MALIHRPGPFALPVWVHGYCACNVMDPKHGQVITQTALEILEAVSVSLEF